MQQIFKWWYSTITLLPTSCILSHPNADSSIWVKYCDLKICHLLKILEHCYMELEVNIQERKTAPRKALSLGNGTTHCMQPPTTTSQTCCLSPLFSYHCGQLWGIIRSQKQDIATILGHISYLLLLIHTSYCQGWCHLITDLSIRFAGHFLLV